MIKECVRKLLGFFERKEEWIWVIGYTSAEAYLVGCHIYNHELKEDKAYHVCRYINDAYDYCDPITNSNECFRVEALVKESDWKAMNYREKSITSCIAKEIVFKSIEDNKRWIDAWISKSKYSRLSKDTVVRLSDQKFANGFLN